MNMPVFDLHCDTALKLLGTTLREHESLRKNEFHIDLERASQLGGYCQCFACFTTTEMNQWYTVSAEEIFHRELENLNLELEKNSDLISIAYTAEDVLEHRANGKMSAILTIEGPAGFGFDEGLLPILHTAGFRITSLGWNELNVLTGSNLTGGGLTEKGKNYVKAAEKLGMLIDVSHISDEGFWDVLETASLPVIATHSNSRALCGHSRNLTDEMFKAICQSGGVAGLNQYSQFLGEAPTLDTACDHILHWLELDPSGKHIALGGDLDGCEELPEGFSGVQSYGALAERLMERGVSKSMTEDIFWNNAVGVMKAAVSNHKK